MLLITGEIVSLPYPYQSAPASAPHPGANPVADAMAVVTDAMRKDVGYAWSWHCNIAMAAVDSGCPHDIANEAAARFLQLLANVDTRKHDGFAQTQAKTAPDTRPNSSPEDATTLTEGQNKQPSDQSALPLPPKYVEIRKAIGGTDFGALDEWVRCKVEQVSARQNGELIIRDGMALRSVLLGPNCRRADQPAPAAQAAKPAHKPSPRVTPADVEAAIASEHYFTAADGVSGAAIDAASVNGRLDETLTVEMPLALTGVQFCVLFLKNGHIVTGEALLQDLSKPDPARARESARRRAFDKAYDMVVYAERERLAKGGAA